MNVTNEQAKSALKADHITGNTTKIIKEYAKDLLQERTDNVVLSRKLLEMSNFLESQRKIWDAIGENVKKIMENQDRAIIQQQVQPDKAQECIHPYPDWECEFKDKTGFCNDPQGLCRLA